MSQTKRTVIGKGWARTAVNATIFRRNSVVSNSTFQYVAYYDEQRRVVLARRKLGTDDWTVEVTQYTGNTSDAHNIISIMVDGAGYLHMAWDHHVDELRYCQSIEPNSLKMTDKLPMTSVKEDKVTYPEFYKLADGNLLFFYRDGSSGRGDLMINHYDVHTQTWSQRQDNLISGEDERNAYWQITIDDHGTIHLSWVWRETPDVATNHDMCYAKSDDQGVTWQKSTGEAYTLPITQSTAEYAHHIPQNSFLMNQTAMCADSQGRPYIATYWRPEGSDVPQYHIIYHDGMSWQIQQVTQRQTPFDISGTGSRRVPFSRPQIMVNTHGEQDKAYIVFRDVEHGNRVSVAICDDLQARDWHIEDLTDTSVTVWEPSYDTELWRRDYILCLFVQNTEQGDGEKEVDLPPQDVTILEWKP
jgi:hypothetical protein